MFVIYDLETSNTNKCFVIRGFACFSIGDSSEQLLYLVRGTNPRYLCANRTVGQRARLKHLHPFTSRLLKSRGYMVYKSGQI